MFKHTDRLKKATLCKWVELRDWDPLTSAFTFIDCHYSLHNICNRPWDFGYIVTIIHKLSNPGWKRAKFDPQIVMHNMNSISKVPFMEIICQQNSSSFR